MQQRQCKSSAAHAAGRRCRRGSRRGSRCGRGRGRGRGPREGLVGLSVEVEVIWRAREQGGGRSERKGGQGN